MSGVFDGDEVLERVGQDRELLAELVVLLREECERLLPAIDEAIADPAPEALEQAAHKLKGSLGQMASLDAYATARELEQMGRHGELTGAAVHSDRLRSEVATLLVALELFCAGAGEE